VSRCADEFPAGPAPRYAPVMEAQHRPRARLFTKDVSQTQLILGVRACSRHDERRFALRLLNTILGENMSSRLFQELREERGLAYHVASSVSFFHDVGTLDIAMGLDTSHVRAALDLTLRELRRLAAAPPTGPELTRARDYTLGQFALGLENTENQMTLLGEQWLGLGKLMHPEEIKGRLALVTAQDIQSAACDFFRPERLNLAAVSPLKSESRLRAMLTL
jgi:predicted Zn-dependent peptidase